jgi:hypothetical protein
VDVGGDDDGNDQRQLAATILAARLPVTVAVAAHVHLLGVDYGGC